MCAGALLPILLSLILHVHRKHDIVHNCVTAVSDNRPTDFSTVIPYYDCGSSGCGVVRKMQYGCAMNTCGTTHVDLSSACIKCAMCMAIADEINETLLDAHYMMVPDDWLNNTEVVLLLRTICDESFRQYSLREIDGKRFISDPLPGDKLLPSSADGLWEKSLRDLCHNYLDEIQELRLYEHWKGWCKADVPGLEDILCRNEISSLRDCRGMNSVRKSDEYLRRSAVLA